MQRRLVVATDCPTCGAPLDFAEGSNAVRCRFCRSNLLVTGRKQVLTYSVEPRVEPRTAARSVWLAQRKAGLRMKATSWERYFVPYYRLVGHDLRWETVEEAPLFRADQRDTEIQHGAAGAALAWAMGAARATPTALRHRPRREKHGALRARYVDKNFIACDLRIPGIYSLGVRLAVLRLRLFQRTTLMDLGHVMAADFNPRAALERGMDSTTLTSGTLYRQVLGRALSVVFYPLCVVTTEGHDGTSIGIVDGVSGTVLTTQAPASVWPEPADETGGDSAVAGFRPLVCPNCGWDLPVEPHLIAFFCSSCERVWELVGDQLHSLAYRIALPDGHDRARAEEERYLPFWILSPEEADTGPREFFVPAFHYRNLRVLADLARDMSGRARRYTVTDTKAPALHGCYYDQEDAVALAEITYPGLTRVPDRAIQELRTNPISFSRARLTWFPFRREGRSLRDPFTGRALDERLLATQ